MTRLEQWMAPHPYPPWLGQIEERWGGGLCFLSWRLRLAFREDRVGFCWEPSNNASAESAELRTLEPPPLAPRPLQLTPSTCGNYLVMVSSKSQFLHLKNQEVLTAVCRGALGFGHRGLHTAGPYSIFTFYSKCKADDGTQGFTHVGQTSTTELHPYTITLNVSIWG